MGQIMKADYDSQADALQIDLLDVERIDRDEDVDDGTCTVAIAGGKAAGIELLRPHGRLELLRLAAERYDLDAQALEAAAKSALAAPDRAVTLDVAAEREPQL